MATRALTLDSTLSEAHTALAALLTDDADWTNAEAEFKRAIDLEPGNSLAHQWYATMLATVDRKDEALQEIRRAAELDPLSQPLSGAKVDIERYAGVRDSKLVLTERANMIDPTHPGTVAALSINLARRGRCDDAYAENKRAQELAPDNTTIRLSLVGVHMLCNRRSEARALLDSVERRPDVARTGIYLAEVFAAKQPDSAFAWLDRTEWSMSSRFQLRVSPRLAPLRADPRYPRLLARMGLR
jgi:Tfp pilus assembly protein PilF